MSDRHRSWSRREFVERMGIVAAVGLLRRPVNATAEPRSRQLAFACLT
jgi:hypothetical protein